jgi:hypothetical protein
MFLEHRDCPGHQTMNAAQGNTAPHLLPPIMIAVADLRRSAAPRSSPMALGLLGEPPLKHLARKAYVPPHSQARYPPVAYCLVDPARSDG